MLRSLVEPRTVLAASLVWVLFSAAVAPGQTDLFTFAIEGPAALAGRPGQTVTGTYHATLKHEGPGNGSQGWSFGIVTESIRITRATLDGTASATIPDGGYRDPDGSFHKAQIINPEKNGGLEGLISYVTLSTQGLETAVLPPRTTQRILRMDAAAVIPPEEGIARFEYRAGLTGTARIDMVVTQDGESGRLDTLPSEIRLGPAEFRRGDANSDTRVNISDYIWILNGLFLGGPASACADAADANDDGAENISDVLHLLNFLFLGSSLAPPAPGPSLCGPDPTEDALECGEVIATCP